MKKSNAILKAAVSAALLSLTGAASAGTLSGNTTFATEVFGPTATTALGITPGAINYSMSTATNVNPAAVIYFTLRLAGGKFSTAPAVGELKFAGIPCAAATSATEVKCTVTLSTDKTTAEVKVDNYASTVNLGLGALTYTPAALGIDNVNTTLATAGGTVTMTGAVTLTGAASAGALDSTNTMPATIDAPAPTSAIATSAQAVVGTVTASSAFPTATTGLGAAETGKINLALTNPASLFTTTTNAASTTILNLGAVKFANVTGTQYKADGATSYLVSNMSAASKMSGTVTGSFKTGTTIALFTDVACTAAAAVGSAGTMTPATNPTTATWTASTAPGFGSADAAGTDLFICMTVPTTTTTAIPETTPTASFAVTAANKTATTDAATTASGTLYALKTNGASYDVRSYVPKSATGYTSFVRVINTGLIAAPVSIALVDETTGVAGTASVVISSLAAGAAKTLTSTEIEAVIGTITPDTARPRLRVTAPTNAINVQSFMLQPGGAFTDATGAQ